MYDSVNRVQVLVPYALYDYYPGIPVKIYWAFEEEFVLECSINRGKKKMLPRCLLLTPHGANDLGA